MAVVFISEENNYAPAFLCFVLALVIILALYFRFNYGITINERRVIAIEQAAVKILKYDDVSNIIVKFTDDSISAHIKMKNQQTHTFMWYSIFLGNNLFLPSEINVKLRDEWVEKSIASLSECPKVKIQNFYTATQASKETR